MTFYIKTFYFTTRIVFAHLELILEACQDLEIQTPDVSVLGVQTSLDLPNFAWMLGNNLSLRFRYDILKERFIGFNDMAKYKQWNLLGYAIHEKFESYIAFPDVTEPNRLITITRNYEKELKSYFLPQYPEQDFFIFMYEMPSEFLQTVANIPLEAILTPLVV